MPTIEPSVDAATHRKLAVTLFNRTWHLLDLDRPRTPDENDELLHAAHASRYHWSQCGTDLQTSRGENQCARVYAALGRGEPAIYHARRCMELQAGLVDLDAWEIASAREVMARALLCDDQLDDAKLYVEQAREALENEQDAEDREIIAAQIAELGI